MVNMIDRRSDIAIVGDSYLSYLFGLKLLKNKKKVLVLHDPRMGYGPYFGNLVSELEFQYLNNWATEYHIDYFSEESDVLREVDHSGERMFIVGKRRVLLGGTVSRNIEELVRKFPTLFSPLARDAVINESVEKEFMAYIKRTAHSLYYFQHFQNYTLKNLENGMPLALKELFLDFKKRYTGCLKGERESDWENKTFLYMMRALHHQKLSLVMTEFDLFHLFLCLISPMHALDQNKLKEPIKEIFLGRGGQVKKAEIEEWKFHKKKPWCLKLSSFEGIIQPKKILLMGSIPTEMPIELSHVNRLYRAIKLRWDFHENWQELEKALGDKVGYKNYTICDEGSLGSPLPLVHLAVSGSFVEACFYREIRQGEKVSFLEEELRQRLLSILHKVAPMVPAYPEQIKSQELSYTPDILVEKPASLPKLKTRQDVSLYPEPPIRGADGDKLKDVHYFGFFPKSGLGLLSTMVDMREKSVFL